MNTHLTDGLREHLKQFVVLRRGGADRDTAWRTVAQNAGSLNETERNQLLYLAKEWEKQQGFQYRQQRGLNVTMLETTEIPSMSNGSGDVRRIRPLNNSLANLPDTAELKFNNRDIMDQGGYFGENSLLLLYFKGNPTPLQVRLPLHSKELIIGRMTENSPMAPDIDLDKAGGAGCGVSRMHAAIQRQHNRLMISDLGSRNHTQINGKRLHPQERYALRDGDEIAFGSLLVKVRFHHPS